MRFKMGARGGSPAIFGVPPKITRRLVASLLGKGCWHLEPVGETPTGATGTVALPISASNQWIQNSMSHNPVAVEKHRPLMNKLSSAERHRLRQRATELLYGKETLAPGR